MLSACASLRQPSETESAPTAADKAAANTKKAPANARSKSLLKAKVQQTEDVLPGNELSEEILYKVLSSEIAFQRGQWQAAYVTLLSTAQPDPRSAPGTACRRDCIVGATPARSTDGSPAVDRTGAAF